MITELITEKDLGVKITTNAPRSTHKSSIFGGIHKPDKKTLEWHIVA